MSQHLTDWSNNLYPSLVDNISIILENIPHNGILFDIGANTGVITDYVTKSKPDVKAWLFEPVEEYSDYCKDKFSNDPNIHVENIALSDVNGWCKVNKDGSNLGFNQIEPVEHSDIITQTLSTYCWNHRIRYIDFIKIDVEGHECQVLRGMLRFLDGNDRRPMILCEIGWYPESESEMFDLLVREYGYEMTRLDKDVLLKQKVCK